MLRMRQDSSISVAQIMVEFDGVDVVVVLLASRSKSRQKVGESSKSPKKPQMPEKFAKAIGSEERLPKYRSSVGSWNPSEL